MPDRDDSKKENLYEEVDVEIIGKEQNIENLKKAEDFYSKLRRKMKIWIEDKGGEKAVRWGEYMMLVPDFFMLLVRLVRDKRVSTADKAPLFMVIAYYISPIDFIPEIILGPIGYMDDLVLAVMVVNRFINQRRDIVLEHWDGETDLILSVEKILHVAEDLVGQKVWKKLQEYFNKMK